MLHIWMHGSRFALTATPGSSFGLLASVAVPSTSESGLDTLSYPNDRLSVGDEVTIRIIEVDRADPPMKRHAGEGSVEIVADAG
jgi:hypothetical protein